VPERFLLERLRDRDWRLTAQRRVVAEVLKGEHVHLTADEIHVRARELLPEISLATVYNTLNELVALGEVLEVRVTDGPARYDPNVLQEHHHLVCTECGALYDVKPRGVDRLRLSPSQMYGFVVDDVDVVFRGRCATCSAPSSEERP
jgi:Fur family ferric uptake transcriptional regulator